MEVKQKFIVNIAYLGGSHGAFLRYFVDKFSKLTPDIKESPFLESGTAHDEAVKYSGKVDRRTFEDLHGNPVNDYKLDSTVPNIVIAVDSKALFNFTRLFFTRKSDHELTSTYLSVSEDKTTVQIDEHFCNRYNKHFKLLYNIDLNNNFTLPISVVRDFLKLTFLRTSDNKSLDTMEKIKNNLGKTDELLNLSDIWNTDAFINRMQQISDKLHLDLVLGKDAVDLHQQFLTKRKNHETWNRVHDVIEAIKNKQHMDCSKLDLPEQGYLCSWIEKNFDFIQTPLTNTFFTNTKEILDYVGFYPQHYKAMNPNLPKFNNIDNPYYLWANKKL